MAKRGSVGRSNTKVAAVGYRKEQWGLLRARAADPEKIEDTFEAWLQLATRMEREWRERGVEIARIESDVLVMLDWCKRNDLPFDSNARSRYAAEELRKREIIEK